MPCWGSAWPYPHPVLGALCHGRAMLWGSHRMSHVPSGRYVPPVCQCFEFLMDGRGLAALCPMEGLFHGPSRSLFLLCSFSYVSLKGKQRGRQRNPQVLWDHGSTFHHLRLNLIPLNFPKPSSAFAGGNTGLT